MLDAVWKEHLYARDHLRQGIGLRAYGQRDPLNEYKTEAFALFNAMLDELKERVTAMLRARFPKVEILQGSLAGTDERDEQLRQAIGRADLFIRNSGMGQDTNFMEFCRKIGKPYGLYGQA